MVYGQVESIFNHYQRQQIFNKMLRVSSNAGRLTNLKMGIEFLNGNVTKNFVRASSSTNLEKLPSFPLPKLEDTIQKYLRSVQPLLQPDEFQRSTKIANEFIQSTNIGSKLQSLLQQRANTKENWLSDYWLKAAYLSYRISVVVNSNPGLFFPTKFFENDYQWLLYASKIISSSILYKDLVDQNKMKQEYAGKYPLDMSQYKQIFGTCRIPARDVDTIIYNPNSKYIIVAYKNAFFKINVYGSNGVKSENEILEQLLLIVRGNVPINIPVGILTSEHRDTLAVAYEKLIKDPTNKESVDIISKCLFIVCLDESVPFTRNDDELNVASHQLIHGGGSKYNSGNRWFDKTIQFIVNRNGINGINYEHSPAEGQPIATLTDFILKYLKTETSDDKRILSTNTDKPIQLKFNITENILNDINIASDNIDKLSQNLDMNVIEFKSYGKSFIKSQKMSPDSFIQIAMQYAFYKYHGEPAAHYETAQQRMFIYGRTETIRSCSIESIAFAKGMCNATISDSEKVNLLKEAVKGHKDYTVMAMTGAGVDRHLLGLKLIANDNGIKIPEFYSDKAFVKSTHFRVSTSQVASNNKVFMCYGPVVEDGYGICYNPRENEMFFAVSAFNSCSETSAKKMGDALTNALQDMYTILCNAGEKPKSKM